MIEYTALSTPVLRAWRDEAIAIHNAATDRYLGTAQLTAAAGSAIAHVSDVRVDYDRSTAELWNRPDGPMKRTSDPWQGGMVTVL